MTGQDRPPGSSPWNNPLRYLVGPISLLIFAALLLAGFFVLAVLCSGLRDPAMAIQNWKAWAKGGSLTLVDLIVGAVLAPMPSVNHTFQAMDKFFGGRGWDMRWLRIGLWIAPVAYVAVAHYRYEGTGPLVVAGVLTVLTWLTALGYPKLDSTGRVVASSS